MKLISHGAGHYESEDGNVLISLDSSFETECFEPHPVRMRLTNLDSFSDWYKRSLLSKGQVKGAYLTYLCEGGQSHFYSQWTARIGQEWTEDVYDRFADAKEAVEKLLGEKVTISKPRKPKAEPETFEDARGARMWAKCGHRAEYDINMNCYTCHRKPS